MTILGHVYCVDIGNGKKHYVHLLGNHWRRVTISKKDQSEAVETILNLMANTAAPEEPEAFPVTIQPDGSWSI